MPRRPNLDPARRAAMKAELAIYATKKQQAVDDELIHILRCWEEGLTDDELASFYSVSRQTIIKWRREGEQARDRRRSVDPDRPGEYDQVS